MAKNRHQRRCMADMGEVNEPLHTVHGFMKTRRVVQVALHHVWDRLDAINPGCVTRRAQQEAHRFTLSRESTHQATARVATATRDQKRSLHRHQPRIHRRMDPT